MGKAVSIDKIDNEKGMKKNKRIKKEKIKEIKVKEKEKIIVKRIKDKKVVTKRKVNLKNFFTKDNIIYFLILLFDVILVIYLARKNIVNYVVVSDVEVFVSKTSYLLWGRNYVNLVVIAFFYIYTCLVNKFILHRKNTKKFLILLFIGLILLNVLLFFLFTKRVY